MRKTHQWTEEERDIVRCNYQGTVQSAQEIADRLGVSLVAVKGQVQSLGVAKITDRRKWDTSQDERLRELLEHYPVGQVAKRMGRTINSVSVRAKRLGISRRDRFDWYTKSECAAILGKNHRWVQARIDSGALPATSYYGKERPTQLGQSAWKIKRSDLRQFIRRFPEELNGRNVDLIAIVDILVGLQPPH